MTFDHDTAAVEAMAGATEAATPPDDASDLWGWPPTKPRRCLGCGVRAEIYFDGTCWLCTHSGQRELVKRNTLPHEWRRLANGEG
jgi:hypothetical protein